MTETTAAPKAPAKKETSAKKDAPKGSRSKFSEVYPEKTKLAWVAKENPKKKGSKAAARFGKYMGSSTVQEFLQKGGTYQDLAFDIGRGHVKTAA